MPYIPIIIPPYSNNSAPTTVEEIHILIGIWIVLIILMLLGIIYNWLTLEKDKDIIMANGLIGFITFLLVVVNAMISLVLGVIWLGIKISHLIF